MLAKRDPYIASAYQQLQIISQDKEKREEYEARERAIRDHNQMMKESREEGHAEGHAEGLAEGRAEGRAEGLTEGRAEGERMTICRLLKTMSPNQIADALEMPLEAIQQIMQELNP